MHGIGYMQLLPVCHQAGCKFNISNKMVHIHLLLVLLFRHVLQIELSVLAFLYCKFLAEIRYIYCKRFCVKAEKTNKRTKCLTCLAARYQKSLISQSHCITQCVYGCRDGREDLL